MNANFNSTSPTRVLIAIQARSNSSRFPGKIYQTVGKKSVLNHVIDAAKAAKFYVERKSIQCGIAILHPEADFKLVDHFSLDGILLIAGDEHDVLSRFIKAKKETKADYIVRLTSDCPLLLDYMISKHINVATINGYDYVSNVCEDFRQCADGFDVEVVSAKAIDWLEENARTKEHREHVTLAIREENPIELRKAFVSSKIDTSNMKLSLDTEEDLLKIRDYYHVRENKMNLAFKTYGRKNVFEL